MRQLLITCPATGDVWADVLVDVRALTYAEVDHYRGWTCTLRQARAIAGDLARITGATVHLVEVVHHPERRTYTGRRTRQAVTFCRTIATIEVPSTDAAAAA